jgi:hypothetical protein
MNKNIYIIKAQLIYLSILSLCVCVLLLSQIGELLSKFNIFFICVLLLNLFTVAYNAIFFFRKNTQKDWTSVLLYNSVYALICGFSVRVGGMILANNLGTDISIYLTKNQAGTDYGFNWDSFNIVVKLLFYDTSTLSGFSIQLNLVMLFISGFLFFHYKRITPKLSKN